MEYFPSSTSKLTETGYATAPLDTTYTSVGNNIAATHSDTPVDNNSAATHSDTPVVNNSAATHSGTPVGNNSAATHMFSTSFGVLVVIGVVGIGLVL